MTVEPEVWEDGRATVSPAHDRKVQLLRSPAEEVAQVQPVDILAWGGNGFSSPHL